MQALRSRRPRTLPEALILCSEFGYAFGDAIAEFLDDFYAHPTPAALSAEPAPTGNALNDAYLAAVAEHLATQRDWIAPDWVQQPTRFLKTPFFAGGMEGMKAVLLRESPVAFRRRQIFVSENALTRA